MSQPIRGQGGYPVFLISLKKASLVEDVEILLPVKFCWILFSGFRGKVENVSANHRPGLPFCLSDPTEKHKLGRGRWDLAFYQVSSNSFQRFQRKGRKCLGQSEARAAFLFFHDWPEKHKRGRRHWELASCQVSLNSVQRLLQRSRKCLSQSQSRAAILFFRSARKTQTWKRALRSCFLSSFVEFRSAVSTEKSKMSQPIRGQGGHLIFLIGPKNTNLVEGFEILLPIKFRWIRFSGFRGEVENVSANQRPGRPSCFSNRPEKHKLGRGLWDLASCQVSLNSAQRFQRRSRKCLSQWEARTAILFFLIGPKNTNLVEGVEILLPVKFRWILFSGFRGEVENVSANQRPGRPSYFSDQPEKHKLGRGRWDLTSCQVSLNSVQRFQRRSWKCLSQSEARAAILFFLSARKTQTW